MIGKINYFLKVKMLFLSMLPGRDFYTFGRIKRINKDFFLHHHPWNVLLTPRKLTLLNR